MIRSPILQRGGAAQSASGPSRALLAALCWAGVAAAAPSVSVQFVPSPLPMAAARVLVYELNVRTAASDACARLVDVTASGGDAESALEQRYQGPLIAANTLAYTADMQPLRATPVDIPPGGGAVVFFYLTIADGKPAPASLRHRLRFTACTDASDATQDTVVNVPGLRMGDAAPVVVGLPFRGEGWVAGDSSNAGGVHRRTLIPLRDASGQPLTGQFHVPERYAIDWVKTDAQARRAQGPLDRNASYLAWHQEILAVADGVVTRTRDGFADETPPFNPPNPSTESAAGNYIMQDIGGGHYAFYAHLSPGSLRVAEGEHVRRGQVIALLGNTGNSSEPHLHFHVSDANDPLVSEGVPFVFDRFQVTGQADAMNEDTGLFDDYVRHAAVPMAARMPQSFSVLSAEAMPLAPPRPPAPPWRGTP